MTLQQWLINGWLKSHKTSKREIADLLRIAERDLQSCDLPGLSLDWRLNIAYNAALQAAAAALAAAGYRAERESHHYHLIQSLALTLGSSNEVVNELDAFRKKRNVSVYDRAGSVTQGESDEMVALARTLMQTVQAWLAVNHPQLS